MICQLCVDDQPKVDESDMREGFTGHEICLVVSEESLLVHQLREEITELTKEVQGLERSLTDALRDEDDPE
jgi:hypothetical protein